MTTPKNLEEAASRAPYVGLYSLVQGTKDPVGQVSLLLFAEGDYAIAYFGGIQHGTWQPLTSGEIELREWPGNVADFVVYGRQNTALGNHTRLVFEGFRDSHAKIGLVKTEELSATIALHPAFNVDANCYASSYHVMRPAGTLHTLQLAVYQEAAYAVQFTKKLLYSFPIEARYNDYRVLHLANASKPRAIYSGRLIDDRLLLYPNAAGATPHKRPSVYGPRYPISVTDLREVSEHIQEVRKPLPTQLVTRNDSDETTLTHERVPGTTLPLQEAAVRLLAPLFTACCE